MLCSYLTQVTLPRAALLPTVGLQMSENRQVYRKIFRKPSCRSANLPCQLAALSALVIAEPALVRLLPSVAPSVHRQVGTVLEHLQGERI